MKSFGQSRRASVILSFVFAAIFVVFLFVLACILPRLVDGLIATRGIMGSKKEISQTARIFILVLAYIMVAVAFLTVGLLTALLRCVLREQVFTDRAVSLLSAISWCCIAEGGLFLAMGIWFYLSLLVFAAAFFLGLCLRIVCNVLAEATRYKAENDLTV